MCFINTSGWKTSTSVRHTWVWTTDNVKSTLEQATKTQRGGGIWLYSFFNLSARWVCGQCHVPAPLAHGKTRYPLCRRLGGPGTVWTGAENFALSEIRSPNRPARSESLYRLSYIGMDFKGKTSDALNRIHMVHERTRVNTVMVRSMNSTNVLMWWATVSCSMTLPHAVSHLH
jgi:hypothetical protein